MKKTLTVFLLVSSFTMAMKRPRVEEEEGPNKVLRLTQEQEQEAKAAQKLIQQIQEQELEKLAEALYARDKSDANFELIEQLVSDNLDSIDAPFPGSSSTPLQVALEQGNIRIIKLLIDSGANLYERDSTTGYTPLEAAIAEEQENVVKLLIDSGAEAGIKDALFAEALGLDISIKERLKRHLNLTELAQLQLVQTVVQNIREHPEQDKDSIIKTALKKAPEDLKEKIKALIKLFFEKELLLT
jgi:ankyrin repeat protein